MQKGNFLGLYYIHLRAENEIHIPSIKVNAPVKKLGTYIQAFLYLAEWIFNYTMQFGPVSRQRTKNVRIHQFS